MAANHYLDAGEARSIKSNALHRRATERLARIDDVRAAVRLSRAGKSQREIAALLHVTQPVVHRLLRAALVDGGVEESPEEKILRSFVCRTPRSQLIGWLSSYEYTFPEYAPHPHEGKTRSTWDQVEAAAVAGFLSADEYRRVHDAVNPPPTI